MFTDTDKVALNKDLELPKKLHEAITTALENGWSIAVNQQVDTGGSPFVSLEAGRKDSKPVRITWHTRETGTYRLFTCMVGANRAAHDTTLTKALATLAEATPEEEAA